MGFGKTYGFIHARKSYLSKYYLSILKGMTFSLKETNQKMLKLRNFEIYA